MCGAAGCGKGFSVVKNWRHSQRDKDNKDLWFCYPCSDKEVGIPQFPPLNLDVPSRTVSLNASTFHFLFFAVAATREGSGEDVRELPGF